MHRGNILRCRRCGGLRIKRDADDRGGTEMACTVCGRTGDYKPSKKARDLQYYARRARREERKRIRQDGKQPRTHTP